MHVPFGPFFTLLMQTWRRFVPSEETLRQVSDRLRTDILFAKAAQASASEAARDQQAARRSLADHLDGHDVGVREQHLIRNQAASDFEKASLEKTNIELPWWKFWLNRGVLSKLELQRTQVKVIGDRFIQCGHQLQLAEKTEKEMSDILRRHAPTTGGSVHEEVSVGREQRRMVG